MAVTVSLTMSFIGENGSASKRKEEDFCDAIAAVVRNYTKHFTTGSISGGTCTYVYAAGSLAPGTAAIVPSVLPA
jgi:hypothetical protein